MRRSDCGDGNNRLPELIEDLVALLHELIREVSTVLLDLHLKFVGKSIRLVGEDTIGVICDRA